MSVPYFEMLDNEDVRRIGYFDDISDALDRASSNAVWVFSEDGLKKFVAIANDELDRARNSS